MPFMIKNVYLEVGGGQTRAKFCPRTQSLNVPQIKSSEILKDTTAKFPTLHCEIVTKQD